MDLRHTYGEAWIGVGLIMRCHFQVHCGSGNYGSKSWPALCWDYGTWMRTQLHALQGQHLFCIAKNTWLQATTYPHPKAKVRRGQTRDTRTSQSGCT